MENQKPYIKSTRVDSFEKLLHENSNSIFRRLNTWLLFFIFLLSISCVYMNEKINTMEIQMNEHKELSNYAIQKISSEQEKNNFYVEMSKPITGTALVELVENMNIQHPKIVIAQAIIESGFFKSDLFKTNNNLFGMRKAYQRPTVHMPTGIKLCFTNYSYYYSWHYSVYDYALWQTAYARNLTENEYLDVLRKSYAEDEKYISKIKNIISGCKTAKDIIVKYNL